MARTIQHIGFGGEVIATDELPEQYELSNFRYTLLDEDSNGNPLPGGVKRVICFGEYRGSLVRCDITPSEAMLSDAQFDTAAYFRIVTHEWAEEHYAEAPPIDETLK